jgi:hypothetical protein
VDLWLENGMNSNKKEEKDMKKKVNFIMVAMFFIVSCAVITVNIYFPEKDVKEAYKNLEKELMKTEDAGCSQCIQGNGSQDC